MTDMDRTPAEAADAGKAPYARPVLVNMGKAADLTESGIFGFLNDGTNAVSATVVGS